uniref:Uncharacterized protein n=1 Tax=Meloidogyne floridensis TaxID=298350 RepID=A0A915P7F9_9BILA
MTSVNQTKLAKFSSKKKSKAKLELSCVNKTCIISHINADRLNRKCNKLTKDKKTDAVKLTEANLEVEKLTRENKRLRKSKKALFKDKTNLIEELAREKVKYERLQQRSTNNIVNCIVIEESTVDGQKTRLVVDADSFRNVKRKADRRKRKLEKCKDKIRSLKGKLAKPSVNAVREFEAKIEFDRSSQTDKIIGERSSTDFKLKCSNRNLVQVKIDSKNLGLDAKDLLGENCVSHPIKLQNDQSSDVERSNPGLSENFKRFIVMDKNALMDGLLSPDYAVELYLQYAPFNLSGKTCEEMDKIKLHLFDIVKKFMENLG